MSDPFDPCCDQRVLYKLRRLQKRPVHATPAAIWCVTGTADTHPAFGEVVDTIVNLAGAAKFSFHRFGGMHHGSRSTVVEDELFQLCLR